MMASTMTAMMMPVDSAPVRPSSSVPPIADGRPATMPAKMMSDAAGGDLLAEPHQEHGAADQRDHGGDAEEPARIGDDAAAAFEPDGDAVGLHQRQQHGAVAGVLVDDLAALLALLLQRLERGDDRCHQLHDDGGGDVGHDAEGKDRHALDRAAREHVEDAEHAAGLAAEGLGEGIGINAGHRDIGAEPVDQERAQREPDALLQVFGFGEGCKVQIGGKLFSSRCHACAPLGLARCACFSKRAAKPSR
jgi:hypothetical protein